MGFLKKITKPTFKDVQNPKKLLGKIDQIIETVNSNSNTSVRISGGEATIIKNKHGTSHILKISKTREFPLIFTAKAQAAGQNDGTVSIKRLNSDGTVKNEDAFDAYILNNKSTTDITSGYWPTIAINDILIVMKDVNGDFIVVSPDVQESDSCP